MFWKDKASDSAAETIRWLFDQKSRSGNDGWPVNLGMTFAKQELGNSLDKPIDEFTVLRTLTRMGTVTSDPLEEFEAAYRQLLVEENAARKPWRLVLPMGMVVDSTVPPQLSIQVDGQVFELLRYSELGQELREAIEPARLHQRLSGEQVDLSLLGLFVVTARHGATLRTALDSLSPSFDLLRGVFEYVMSRSKGRIMSSTQQPRANVPHPNFAVGISGADYDAIRFDVAVPGGGMGGGSLQATDVVKFQTLAAIVAENPKSHLPSP